LRNPNGLERRKDLDGLRGLAVALTILLHYVSRSGFFPHLGPPHLAQILDSAWAGVDIFFVLSGFLIGGIILDHGSSDAFFRVFYLRRALRILPAALLTIGFSYLVLPLLNPSILWPAHVPLYAYLLFINNFWTALGYQSYAPLGPMWSLAIEEQFYFLAPSLLVSCKPRIRNVFLVTVVLISPLLRYWHPGFSGWDFTLFRLDGFALGILLAALTRDPFCMAIASKNRRTITALAVSLSAAALLFASILSYTPSERVAFGVSLNSLATAGLILLLHVDPNSFLSAPCRARGWPRLGNIRTFFISCTCQFSFTRWQRLEAGPTHSTSRSPS
jgi:peptidoglycan/LPS O-acetylase OafA/YrhL